MSDLSAYWHERTPLSSLLMFVLSSDSAKVKGEAKTALRLAGMLKCTPFPQYVRISSFAWASVDKTIQT